MMEVLDLKFSIAVPRVCKQSSKLNHGRGNTRAARDSAKRTK